MADQPGIEVAALRLQLQIVGPMGDCVAVLIITHRERELQPKAVCSRSQKPKLLDRVAALRRGEIEHADAELLSGKAEAENRVRIDRAAEAQPAFEKLRALPKVGGPCLSANPSQLRLAVQHHVERKLSRSARRKHRGGFLWNASEGAQFSLLRGTL